jgi:predicted outer membrane repeat protein
LHFSFTDTSVNIIRSVFVNSSTTGNGAAVYTSARSGVTVRDSNFVNNTCLGFGGALACEDETAIAVSGSNFIDNSASLSGGALYILVNSQATISDTTFKANTATYYGGSIVGYTGCDMTITSSRFSGGNASVGGAIYSTDSTLTLTDVHMSNNTAVNAGAVSLQGDLSCKHSSFSNNIARSRGGAIVGDAESTMYLYKTSFTNNSCQGESFHSSLSNCTLNSVVHKAHHTYTAV